MRKENKHSQIDKLYARCVYMCIECGVLFVFCDVASAEERNQFWLCLKFICGLEPLTLPFSFALSLCFCWSIALPLLFAALFRPKFSNNRYYTLFFPLSLSPILPIFFSKITILLCFRFCLSVVCAICFFVCLVYIVAVNLFPLF